METRARQESLAAPNIGMDNEEDAYGIRQTLTKQQVAQLRGGWLLISPSQVVVFQLGLLGVASLLTLLVSWQLILALSLALGGLAGVLPVMLLAYKLQNVVEPVAGFMKFFTWNLVKQLLTLVLLAVLVWLREWLNLPAVLAGFLIVVSSYWLMLLVPKKFYKFRG